TPGPLPTTTSAYLSSVTYARATRTPPVALEANGAKSRSTEPVLPENTFTRGVTPEPEPTARSGTPSAFTSPARASAPTETPPVWAGSNAQKLPSVPPTGCQVLGLYTFTRGPPPTPAPTATSAFPSPVRSAAATVIPPRNCGS